jgi:hypothetical protein
MAAAKTRMMTAKVMSTARNSEIMICIPTSCGLTQHLAFGFIGGVAGRGTIVPIVRDPSLQQMQMRAELGKT